jgi:hypothetical protein
MPLHRGGDTPERGRDVDVAVNVVGPAVQQHDRLTVGRPGFDVADIEHTRLDLLERPEYCRGHGYSFSTLIR